jgi:hypothetical protein
MKPDEPFGGFSDVDLSQGPPGAAASNDREKEVAT